MDTQQDLTPVVTETLPVHSFVAGYLNARRQSGLAQITRKPWGITVRYGPGMNRQAEHFVSGATGPDAVTPSAGDWLTVLGDEATATPVGFALLPRANEFFMAADLCALCQSLDAAEGRVTAAPVTVFPTAASALFRHEVQGQPVSSACCALALDGDAVLDRLTTDPAHRGLGLARSLTRAAATWALARGCQRLLLIASTEGHALYRRLGFETLAPVHVFTVEKQSHAR